VSEEKGKKGKRQIGSRLDDDIIMKSAFLPSVKSDVSMD